MEGKKLNLNRLIMKNAKQNLGMAILALSMTAAFGCGPDPKKDMSQTLMGEEVVIGKPNSNNVVKIALLLDTSNSMDGLINQAKAQLWDVVNQFSHAKCGNDSRPKLEIALYQYGNDNLSSREGYVQQVLAFSSDLDEISEKLFSLTTNGGEEYCGQVIQTSLRQLDWGKNPDNLKMIFIAGNEPFDQGKLNYKDAAANAKEKDVVVNTIFCGAYQQGVNTNWKNGAKLTGGEYLAIDHNRQVVHIDTPFDKVIIELNSKLNKTYISYGSLGRERIQMQRSQDANAYGLEQGVAVKRAVSKSSSLYNNSKWDLVDAVQENATVISKLEADDLPSELKGLSKTEIETYVGEKNKERIMIQKEIQAQNEKREAYLAQHQKQGATGELENAMLEAIKKQAAIKNYKWD